MRFASDRQASYAQGRPLKDRAAALTIAIAVNVLLLLMLLHLASSPPKPPLVQTSTSVIELPPEQEQTPARSRIKHSEAGGRKAISPATTPKPETRPATHQDTPVPSTNAFKTLLTLNSDEMAMTDRAMHTPQAATKPETVVNVSHRDTDNTPVAGTDSDGSSYYDGDWYRLPTAAEMRPYIPSNELAHQWGEVMCRYGERYHVEDCREFDEYPKGSGMSRALRQMSFQLLVRQPLLNGKPIPGAHVRIRLTLNQIKQEESGKLMLTAQ